MQGKRVDLGGGRKVTDIGVGVVIALEHVRDRVLVVLVVDDEEDIPEKDLELAGAMGISQFMPSNALKLADGSYWAIGSEEADFRYLLLDRDVRGQQLVVQGRLYPDSHTVRLTAVEKLDARVSPSPAVAVRLWPVLI